MFILKGGKEAMNYEETKSKFRQNVGENKTMARLS